MGDNPKMVKIVVFAPETHADAVREAMGKAGAGKMGNYSFCSFSAKDRLQESWKVGDLRKKSK